MRPGSRAERVACLKTTGVSRGCRGWVPTLVESQTLNVSDGWRTYAQKSSLPVITPCSSSRGEDAAVLRTFFTNISTGRPMRHGTFLEIGANDGVSESNTWILEGCLGWQGVLAEGHPRHFNRLRESRPASLNLNLASCDASRWVNFSARAWMGASIDGAHFGWQQGGQERVVTVPCVNLGEALHLLGVDQLDFVSVDVEGGELTTVRSLVASRSLSIGVLLVEVRGDGSRRAIMETALNAGLHYVGQLIGRGTSFNYVMDDAYVNMSHLRARFPHSRALAPPGSHVCATTDVKTRPSMRWYEECPVPLIRTRDGCMPQLG